MAMGQNAIKVPFGDDHPPKVVHFESFEYSHLGTAGYRCLSHATPGQISVFEVISHCQVGNRYVVPEPSPALAGALLSMLGNPWQERSVGLRRAICWTLQVLQGEKAEKPEKAKPRGSGIETVRAHSFAFLKTCDMNMQRTFAVTIELYETCEALTHHEVMEEPPEIPDPGKMGIHKLFNYCLTS